MPEYLQIASFILVIIVNVIVVVWNWAKLDKKLAVMSQKFGDKFDELSKDIKEIKDNDLAHLKQDVKDIAEKLTEHLITHGKTGG